MRTENNKPLLSIVIPTYNEEKYIGRLLRSIKKQKGLPFEIIVADNRSKDKTAKIAKSFGCKVVIGGRPSRGRNNGAKHAKGEYILFLDSDTILPNNFVNELMGTMVKKNLGVISGFYKPDSNKLKDKIFCFIFSYYFYFISYIRPAGLGFYICIKNKIHKKIRGFDEKVAMAEDHDYVERASKHDKFAFLKKPVIIASTRRLNKESAFNLFLKYGYCEILRLLGKKVYQTPFKYEFGKFNK